MNYVFDFGNVIIEWNSERILKEIVRDIKKREKIRKVIFDSGKWEKMDAGELTAKQLYQETIAHLGAAYESELFEIIYHWYRYVDVHECIIEKIKLLKSQGHSIYILSNTSEIFHQAIKERIPQLLDVLSGYVLSYEVKMMKPSEKIYYELIKKYNLDVTKTYFFDDLFDNIEMAKKIGINAYHVKSTSQLNNFLESLIS